MKNKMIIAALVITITVLFVSCSRDNVSVTNEEESTRKTEAITVSVTTAAGTTTAQPTVNAAESTVISEPEFKYGHISVPPDWTYTEAEKGAAYTSPDNKTRFSMTLISGSDIMTELSQTASSLILTMSLNGEEDGYGIYNTTFSMPEKTIEAIAGIKNKKMENAPYGGTFIYTAFADEKNNCIRVVNISCDEVYDINSDEFNELNTIFLSYKL